MNRQLKDSKKQTFTTDNLWLSAWILSNNFATLKGIQKINSRGIFLLEPISLADLLKVISDFNMGKDSVSVSKLKDNLNSLRDKLRETLRTTNE